MRLERPWPTHFLRPRGGVGAGSVPVGSVSPMGGLGGSGAGGGGAGGFLGVRIGVAFFPAFPISHTFSELLRFTIHRVSMNVLLIRPDPGNERFGLGPLLPRRAPGPGVRRRRRCAARGHEPAIVDLRFGRRLPSVDPADARPRLVGISCMHALEYDRVLDIAREVRRLSPGRLHPRGRPRRGRLPRGRSRLPRSTRSARTTARRSCRPLADALAAAAPLDRGPGAAAADARRLDRHARRSRSGPGSTRCRSRRATWSSATATATTASSSSPSGSSRRRAGARSAAASARSGSSTTARSASARSAPSWTTSAPAGDNVFIVDDLFWNHPERSLELARGAQARAGSASAGSSSRRRTRPRRAPPRAARGVAPARRGLRHLLRPGGGLGRGARRRRPRTRRRTTASRRRASRAR